MASKKRFDLKGAVIGGLGGPLLTGLLHTARTELIAGHEVEAELVRRRVPAILVLWHGRLLLPAFHYRAENFATLISRNRDGDHISRVAEGWGYRVIRGSSSRGGSSAFRQILQHLTEGYRVAVTPDGPRGPRQKMKLGPLQAARAAGVPIIPGSASAVRAAYFGRWDRFLVPAPFTWAPIAIGEPMRIPRETSDGELEKLAICLEERLNSLTDLVDRATNARAI